MFKFTENLKIREIIYRYRDFKKSNPNFNEDQLCRLTIEKRLKDYPRLYNLRNNNDDTVKRYMDDLFEKELNLKYVCRWFMEQEYPKYSLLRNSHNLSSWRDEVKNLDNRIEHLLLKIPGI
jgi:hypothetical protein